MKKFISFFLFIFMVIPAYSETIIGGVEKLGPQVLTHKDDYNYSENVAIKTGTSKNFSDREVMRFSDGSYGVRFFNDPLYGWYYDGNGKLISFTKRETMNYPSKMVRYNPQGQIINYSIKISEKESFMYSSNGQLFAHWIGNNCYNIYNELIMTRETKI